MGNPADVECRDSSFPPTLTAPESQGSGPAGPATTEGGSTPGPTGHTVPSVFGGRSVAVWVTTGALS